MLGMLGDKKKIASIILSESPKKIEEKNVPQGLESDFSIGLESLASEMIEGLKNGEPGMVAKALKQFIILCKKEEEYSEPEGD